MTISTRGLDHVVLRVKDMGAMRRFYCDVLGASHVAYRAELRMSHLRAGTAMIDLVESDSVSGRNGPSIYLTDPEGNLVELKGPSDGKGPPPSQPKK